MNLEADWSSVKQVSALINRSFIAILNKNLFLRISQSCMKQVSSTRRQKVKCRGKKAVLSDSAGLWDQQCPSWQWDVVTQQEQRASMSSSLRGDVCTDFRVLCFEFFFFFSSAPLLPKGLKFGTAGRKQPLSVDAAPSLSAPAAGTRLRETKKISAKPSQISVRLWF